MATYKEIQKYVKQRYGYTPKTCWIAHVKALHNLTGGPDPNRRNPKRAHPCPVNKKRDIEEALRHFGMI